MTKDDVRGLIKQGAIVQKRKMGVSRVRARKITAQKKKGRRKGQGKRKGATKARSGRKKRVWIKSVRSQRKALSDMKEKLGEKKYRKLYKMASRGYFTSKNHLRKYIVEKKMLKEK
jgi:large subunit ribosomal protein L19e